MKNPLNLPPDFYIKIYSLKMSFNALGNDPWLSNQAPAQLESNFYQIIILYPKTGRMGQVHDHPGSQRQLYLQTKP